MALTVKVGATDISADVLMSTFRLVNSGFRDVQVLDFTYQGGTAIDPEDPITVEDGATLIFTGKVRNRVRSDFGTGTTRVKVIKVTAQDATSYLTDDVVDSGGNRTTNESDQSRVQWLISTFCTKGITAQAYPTGFIYSVHPSNMPAAQDFTGMNLYEAMEAICNVTGAKFYVDADLKLHYFDTESNPAPWNFSNTPNGSTTKSYFDPEYPDDTIELANAVYVIGLGVADWVTNNGSIDQYGRREASIRDEAITTTAQLNAAGSAFLTQHAFPRAPVRLKTRHSGLRAGMTIQLTDSLWGISAANYPITEVVTRVVKGSTAIYEVTLGSRNITLATQNTDFSRWVNVIEGRVDDAATAALDITPPAVPSAVNATSDLLKRNNEEVVRLIVTVTQPTDGDLYGTWVQVTREEVSEGVPDWTRASKAFIPAADTDVVFEGVAGATSYYVRAYSEDLRGNKSAYVNAATFPVVTAADSNAPTIPTILQTVSALNAIGVLWSSSNATDLRFYQVRWSDDGGTTWTSPSNVYATTYVITGLDNTATYDIGVRAVDVSGNVDDGFGVAVNFQANPNAGYTVVTGIQPGQVESGDIATGAVLANSIAAGAITTDKLTGNTITVKESGDFARGFEVLDGSDVQLGLWDWNGLTIRDPADPTNRFIRLESGSLKLYTDGVNATSAITPDGIDASKVTFGLAAGGHNTLRNSSFELSSNTGVASSATHTDTTAWTASNRTSLTNVTEGTSLSVTTW